MGDIAYPPTHILEEEVKDYINFKFSKNLHLISKVKFEKLIDKYSIGNPELSKLNFIYFDDNNKCQLTINFAALNDKNYCFIDLIKISDTTQVINQKENDEIYFFDKKQSSDYSISDTIETKVKNFIIRFQDIQPK